MGKFEEMFNHIVFGGMMGGAQESLNRLRTATLEMKEDRGGFAAMLIMGIMGIIVGAAMLYIGLFITVTISAAIPPVEDAAYNTTLATVKSNVNTAFTVLGLALLVGGFGVVIYTLRTGFISGEVR